MKDCVFCKIVNGAELASVVYSDDKVMAFMDISQVNLGHVLVIPKGHATYMSELDEEIGAHLFKITMRIAEAGCASKSIKTTNKPRPTIFFIFFTSLVIIYTCVHGILDWNGRNF